MATAESLKRAAGWLEGRARNPCDCSKCDESDVKKTEAECLATLLDAVRYEEAKWWRYLVQMHEESYFAVEGDKRLAALQAAAQRKEQP